MNRKGTKFKKIISVTLTLTIFSIFPLVLYLYLTSSSKHQPPHLLKDVELVGPIEYVEYNIEKDKYILPFIRKEHVRSGIDLIRITREELLNNYDDLQVREDGDSNHGVFKIYRDCDMFTIWIANYEEKIPWRFVCSVESHARVHKDLSVCIYYDFKVDDIYEDFENVKWIKIVGSEIFRNTPLSFYWFSGSHHWEVHGDRQLKNFVDALRLAILFRNNGGVYFDMDQISLNHYSLFEKDTLWKTARDHVVNNAPMLFYENSFFLEYLNLRIMGSFKGIKTGHTAFGPQLITETHEFFPEDYRSSYNIQNPNEQGGMKPNYNFIDELILDVTTEEGRRVLKMYEEEVWVLHVWRVLFESTKESNKLNKHTKGYKNRKKLKNSVLFKILQTHCPHSYQNRILPEWNQIWKKSKIF